jgi:hypothetical protein
LSGRRAAAEDRHVETVNEREPTPQTAQALPAEPLGRATPLTAAWASALGNQRVAAIARDRKTKTAPKIVPLTAKDVEDLKRVGKRTLRELDKLLEERAMTTVEAETTRETIQRLMDKAKVGKGDRAKNTASLNRMRALPDAMRKRAKAARSTKGHKLISDFKTVPPVINVAEHEATRVSFVVHGKPQSIEAQIFEDPSRDGSAFRLFRIDPTAGFHQLIWDGTWEGQGKRPPESGVYRLLLTVTDEDGKSERMFEHIRVENPNNEKVLPRVGNDLAFKLTFDGKILTLTDTEGNIIEVPTVSGLKPNHKKNPQGIDFTDPKWEWEKDKGPIPRGFYVIKRGQFQVPDADKEGKKYPSGGTAAHWGPMRAHIEPDPVGNRGAFFMHMDVTDDGTAGCIGFPTSQEAKFNQIMSLIARSKSDVALKVSY